MGPRPLVEERFARVARSIAGQQLSVTAASTIFGRVVDLVDLVTPASILRTSPDGLRECGLSNAKVAALCDLAQKCSDGTLDFGSLGRIPVEDAVARLTEVKGIGRWTAEMFLIGSLHKLDVWPTGDAGVRNGFAQMTGLKIAPTADELQPMGNPFRPYRTIVAWYCWRTLDNKPV